MPTMTTKVQPGAYGFPVSLKKRYDNYIGGQWTPPLDGQYFENITPVTGQVICEIGVAVAAPMEFIVFRIRQDVTAGDVVEA